MCTICPSSSSSSPQALPSSSQGSLLCSHLKHCPLDEVRRALPYHSTWMPVPPLWQPLQTSSGCGLWFGMQSPEESWCLGSSQWDLPGMAFPWGYLGPGNNEKDSNAHQVQLTILLAFSFDLNDWSSQLTNCSNFLSTARQISAFKCEYRHWVARQRTYSKLGK